MQRLKILISAYACSPYQGSEPGVGWGFVSELAKHHDLWVLVEEEKFRGDIENYLTENPKSAKHVRFFFVRKKRRRRLRKIWPPSYYWFYRQWHKTAYELAQKLHADVQFDLAHQLTMVGFREPGYLWKLGIPFVWGPVGGMGYFPPAFLHKVGAYGGLYYLAYNTFNFAQMHWLKRPRLAAQAANGRLLAATPDNQREIEKHWRTGSVVVPEVGLPRAPVVPNSVPNRVSGEALRIVWSGQHTNGKALNLGLEALARVNPSAKWELHILGRGTETKKWKDLADKLRITENCYFQGWLPRAEALDLMSTAHVMLITSLRDLTSTVTIEALALGLPVVCLDHCGFAHVVDESCGIKVPVTTPKAVVASIALAIERLEGDEPLRSRLAKGAALRAHEFSWARKVAVLNEMYRACIDAGRGPVRI